jgi:hypothetical protein
MKELLYWSPKKVESFYLSRRWWGASLGGLEVSALGASVRMGPPSPVPGEGVNEFAKLARVAQQLTKNKAKHLSELRRPWEPGDWFIFDWKMVYGRSGISSGEDAAIFLTPGVFKESGGVFLFGSARHMIGQAPEGAPHYTSALDWLAGAVERIEEDPAGFMVRDRPRHMRMHWELPRLAAYSAVRRLSRQGQTVTTVRLSGLARILLVQPRCRWETGAEFGPLVVGTPLYVEFGPWNPKW